MKEDEKLERTIRGLSKLPENRRCINCNSLGPQYICTTFNTFICQICSGIHREFTHRVKSISMAKFSQEEVNALKAVGNEKARLIYFKEYDPQRQPPPDSSNMYKLRDFIKHVYVDGRYSGETSLEQLPRLRLTNKEEFIDSRKSLSPRSDGQYDRHYSGRSSPSRRSEDGSFRYYYDERRSPRYPRDSSRSGGYKRSPIKFEVVDDRFRDEYGSSRRSLARGPAFEESKLGNKSPESQRNVQSTCSRTSKKEMPGHDVGASGSIKKVPSAGNLTSTEGNESKAKVDPANTPSVITDDKKPTVTSMEPQKKQAAPSADNKSGIMSTSSRKKGTLEELLFELSVPAPSPIENSFEELGSIIPQSTERQIEPQITTSTSQVTSQASTGLTSEMVETPQSISDACLQPSEAPSPNAVKKAAESGEMSPSIHQIQPPSLFTKDDTSLKDQEMFQSTHPMLLLNKDEPPINPSENIVTDAPETSLAEVPRQHMVEQNLVNPPSVPETSVVVVPQLPVAEQMPGSTRKELPADLFTALYPSVHPPVQAWPAGTPHGMGFNMQYYPQMMAPPPAHSAASKSTNPFDHDDRADVTKGLPFPSKAPLPGGFPNAPSASYGFWPDLSQGEPSMALMPSQPPAYSPFMLNQSLYATGPPLGIQMERPEQNNTLDFGMHGFRGHGGDSSSASSFTTNHHSAPGMPNTFPSSGGGNPFD